MTLQQFTSILEFFDLYLLLRFSFVRRRHNRHPEFKIIGVVQIMDKGNSEHISKQNSWYSGPLTHMRGDLSIKFYQFYTIHYFVSTICTEGVTNSLFWTWGAGRPGSCRTAAAHRRRTLQTGCEWTYGAISDIISVLSMLLYIASSSWYKYPKMVIGNFANYGPRRLCCHRVVQH